MAEVDVDVDGRQSTRERCGSEKANMLENNAIVTVTHFYERIEESNVDSTPDVRMSTSKEKRQCCFFTRVATKCEHANARSFAHAAPFSSAEVNNTALYGVSTFYGYSTFHLYIHCCTACERGNDDFAPVQVQITTMRNILVMCQVKCNVEFFLVRLSSVGNN